MTSFQINIISDWGNTVYYCCMSSHTTASIDRHPKSTSLASDSAVFSQVLEVEVANVKVRVANALPPLFFLGRGGGGGGQVMQGSLEKFLELGFLRCILKPSKARIAFFSP